MAAMRSVPLLLLAAALSGCTLLTPQLRSPTLSIVDVRVRQANLWDQQLTVRVRVRNPNERALHVKGLAYAVYIGGQELVRGASDAGFVVPAQGAAVFNMEVTANAAGVLFAVLREPRGQPIGYRMQGKVELSHGWLRSLPFEDSGTFVVK